MIGNLRKDPEHEILKDIEQRRRKAERIAALSPEEREEFGKQLKKEQRNIRITMAIFGACAVGLVAFSAFGAGNLEVALFQACAKVERDHGRQDRAEVFESAVEALGGSGHVLERAPSRLRCLNLLTLAQVYKPLQDSSK